MAVPCIKSLSNRGHKWKGNSSLKHYLSTRTYNEAVLAEPVLPHDIEELFWDLIAEVVSEKLIKIRRENNNSLALSKSCYVYERIFRSTFKNAVLLAFGPEAPAIEHHVKCLIQANLLLFSPRGREE
jgi:hypothetical protein